MTTKAKVSDQVKRLRVFAAARGIANQVKDSSGAVMLRPCLCNPLVDAIVLMQVGMQLFFDSEFLDYAR